MEHWVWNNLYTKTVRNVSNTLLSLYNDFKKMQGAPFPRQTAKWVKEKLEPYLDSLEVRHQNKESYTWMLPSGRNRRICME